MSQLIPRRRTLLETCVAMLLVFSTLCQTSFATAPVAEGVQPMALLKGGSVVFGGGGGGGGSHGGGTGDQYLSAFCMDINRDPPVANNPFNNYSGKVELTFKGGGKKTYDLSVPQERSEAFQHFRIDGTGKSFALKFSQTNPILESIEFVSTVVAHTGDATDFEKTLDNVTTLEELTSSLPAAKSSSRLPAYSDPIHRAAQDRFWYRPYQIKRVPGTSVTYDYKGRNKDRTAIQQIINLDGRGDAILVRYADVNLLIDTGLSTASLARIAAKLPKNIRLQLILTHRDQDHIGNLTRLLQTADNAGLAIENVIMSSYEVPPFDKLGESTQTVKHLLAELAKLKYKRNDLSGHLTAFTKGASVPITARDPQVVLDVLRQAKKDLQAGGPLSKLLTAQERARLAGLKDVPAVQTFELSISPDLELLVMQKTNPKSPNESSLVTKLVHNGRSTLYTGDINETVMEDLLADSFLADEDHDVAAIQATLAYLKESKPSEFSTLQQRLKAAASEDVATEIFTELVARVLADDAGWIKRLDELSAPAFSLASNVLKWPHHAWLPKTEKGKETLRRFILAVNPETIVFSISPETNNTKFSPADFADADSFAIRLRKGNDPLSRWLLENFAESTRHKLHSVGLNGVTVEQKQALAQELTRLIQGPQIYREELFAGVDLSGIRLNATLVDAERAHVNRELLERAYPREIGEIRGQHVEKVRAYLRQYFPGRHFNIVITARDGDAEFWTLKQRGLTRDIDIAALSQVVY